jgi:hypothetical protein
LLRIIQEPRTLDIFDKLHALDGILKVGLGLSAFLYAVYEMPILSIVTVIFGELITSRDFSGPHNTSDRKSVV